MASIYKRAAKAQAEELSDESMSDVSDNSDSGDESSNTIEGDDDSEISSAEEAQPKLSQVPTELRNRILMLTSRGVSFR